MDHSVGTDMFGHPFLAAAQVCVQPVELSAEPVGELRVLPLELVEGHRAIALDARQVVAQSSMEFVRSLLGIRRWRVLAGHRHAIRWVVMTATPIDIAPNAETNGGLGMAIPRGSRGHRPRSRCAALPQRDNCCVARGGTPGARWPRGKRDPGAAKICSTCSLPLRRARSVARRRAPRRQRPLGPYPRRASRCASSSNALRCSSRTAESLFFCMIRAISIHSSPS
jgi:hypothetical protein